MKRPFLQKKTWPGRRVETVAAAPPPPPVEASDEQAASILPIEDHPYIREAHRRSDQAISRLEEQARKELDEHLHIPVLDLPQTQEAVRILAGTHPQFGSGRAAVVPEHRLDQDEEIDRRVFERAYNTMERADRISLGFDVGQLIDPDYDGTVVTNGPITSPAEAAGEVPIPMTGGRKTLEEAIEERTTMSRREMAYMVFINIIYFVLDLIGDTIKGLAERTRRALSFKILGRRIGVGKFVAKPFFWIADLFHKLARKLERQALGVVPKAPDVPPSSYGDAEIDMLETGANEDGEEVFTIDDDDNEDGFDLPPVTQEDLDAVNLPPLDSPEFKGSTGMVFLMAALTVLRTVDNASRNGDNKELWDALRRYEGARQYRQQHINHTHNATVWGVSFDDTVALPDRIPAPPTIETEEGATPRIDCE